MKRLSSLILAVLMLLSVFAVTASALELPESTQLVVKKYQVPQMNGETTLTSKLEYQSGEKKDESKINYETLEGVEFSIFKLEGMPTYDNTYYFSETDIRNIDETYKNGKITYNDKEIGYSDKQTTDKNGLATFNVAKADFGLYFVKETAAPANVTAKSQSFVVVLPRTNPNGDDYLAATYVYPKNYTTLGGAILQKIDSTKEAGKQGLKGAQFAIYNTNGTPDNFSDDTQVTADFYGKAIGEANNNNWLTTDDNGYIYVNNLIVGDYYFVEKVAPTGYIIKIDIYRFSVVSGKSTEVIDNLDGTFKHEGLSVISADNSSQPQIEKYVTSIGKKDDNTSFDEEVTWIVISDVPSDMDSKYTSYKVADIMDEELIFVDGSVTVTTSKDGKVFDGVLDESKYDVIFDKNNEAFVEGASFVVDFSNNTADLKGLKLIKIEYKTTLDQAKTVMGDAIENDVVLKYATAAFPNGEAVENEEPWVYTGGFKFLKVSTDDSVLEGAVFDVYSVNDDKNPVRTGITSDKNGIFEVKGLKDGDYYLVETKAPEKHELLTTKFNFTVTKTSYTDTPTVKVTNVPIPDVPLTGGIGTTLFTVAGLSLIALAAVLFVLSRKTKKSN